MSPNSPSSRRRLDAVAAAALVAASTCATAAPVSSCNPAALCFSGGLSSGAVLQRAPARAALYGSVPLAAAGAVVSVRLVSEGGGGGAYNKSFDATSDADGVFKVLLDPMPAGGNFSATATTRAGLRKTIIDLTFGDVLFCAGQSNMWLPLWFTVDRNETTAAVAAGGYANIRLWRGGLGETPDGPNWLSPEGVEPGSDGGDALTNQWRHPRDVLSPNDIRYGEPWFWEFPSTCWYAAARLTDLLGAAAPPLGLMTVPVGGTMVEQWSSPAAQASCRNVTCMCDGAGCDPYGPISPAACPKNSDLFYGNIQPFVNTTIKLFLWYQGSEDSRARERGNGGKAGARVLELSRARAQPALAPAPAPLTPRAPPHAHAPRSRPLTPARAGENNLEYDGGNSAQGTGYGCLLPAMVAEWRALWSAAPGTTEPLAPFGFVSLADGTDESFGVSMAGLRWAQTANYGVAPNPAMPATFAALAHDAGDPWDDYRCADPDACCVDASIPLGPDCQGDHRGQWSVNGTGWFMGQIHPRVKGVVGARLGQAAFASAYGGPVIGTGPVFTGCTLAGATLTLHFNATLLAGERVVFDAAATVEAENTALYVLGGGATLPADAAANHHAASSSYRGPYANGNELGVEGWVPVRAVAAGGGGADLRVDVSALGGAAPTAVRYAWGTGGWGAPFIDRMCCGPTVDVELAPCAPGSCPLKATGEGTLPGWPFVAEITAAGKCRCLAPMTCDA